MNYTITIETDEIKELALDLADYMGLEEYSEEEIVDAVYRCLCHKIETAKEDIFQNGNYRSVKNYLQTAA